MDHKQTVEHFYKALSASQHWPAATLATHQRTQLERLLRFARAEVPFYRDRLAPLFGADGRIDWSGWQDLPLLTRRDLADKRDQMQAEVLPPGHGAIGIAQSSGTTGTPVTVSINKLATAAADAALLRAYDWHGIDWSQTMVRWDEYQSGRAPWPEGRDEGRWGAPFAPPASRGRLWALDRETPASQALEFLARHRPRYLIAGPASAETLASTALAEGISLGIEAILTHGGWIFEATRALCREAFGARMIGLYSSQEALRMAHPCRQSALYHVNVETTFLEVLRDDGTPAPPGELGRVIVTPLFSSAQPLIRYQLGDLAVRGGACPCGRHLPTLARIEGRVTQMFRLPDGRRVFPQLSEMHLASLGGRSWQIAQVGPLDFEVRYVPRGDGGLSDAGPVTRALVAALHPQARVRIVLLDALPVARTGKIDTYVCELDAGPDA